MALESFFNKENVNIKDLALEKEKEPISESRKLYNSLKKSKFYDQDKKQWNDYLTESQELVGAYQYSETQHLGILAEHLFDEKSAKAQYEKLKLTELYDSENKHWKSSDNLDSSVLCSAPQLSGILVEALFDKEQAEEKFGDLKTTELYDWHNHQWNESLDQNLLENQLEEGMGNPNRFADSQLLGVLVESVFDKESARRLFEELKKSDLYDKNNNQWNTCIGQNQKHVNSERYSSSQLLGIWAEAIFNKDSAKNLLNNLKNTELYDAARKQWRWSMNEYQKLSDSDRKSHVQLLGVIIENLFEEKLPKFDSQILSSIPEARKY